jgi:prepilin-type N-terminal cleavage/methylation domain-containing protein
MRRTVSQGQPESGFTMVELLVTMVLLTIVLLGLAALQVGVIRQVSASRRASEATRLGQAILEERYLATGYGNIALRGWTPELKRDGAATMTRVGGDGESPGPYTVDTLVESAGGLSAKVVTVRVSWTDMASGTGPAPPFRVHLTGLRTP